MRPRHAGILAQAQQVTGQRGMALRGGGDNGLLEMGGCHRAQ